MKVLARRPRIQSWCDANARLSIYHTICTSHAHGNCDREDSYHYHVPLLHLMQCQYCHLVCSLETESEEDLLRDRAKIHISQSAYVVISYPWTSGTVQSTCDFTFLGYNREKLLCTSRQVEQGNNIRTPSLDTSMPTSLKAHFDINELTYLFNRAIQSWLAQNKTPYLSMFTLRTVHGIPIKSGDVWNLTSQFQRPLNLHIAAAKCKLSILLVPWH